MQGKSQNMKHIATIQEKDIFPDKIPSEEKISFEDRLTGKVILFDTENRIALIGTTVNTFLVLPGGGIDPTESIENGIIREAKEETGCVISLKQSIGTIEDYRNRDKKHCVTHCYIGTVEGEKGQPFLTKEELSNGLYVQWVYFYEAEEILKNEVTQVKEGGVDFYNTCFNIARDYLFILEAKKKLAV
jgi:ADP-ribose pyrophosphatase YjhB (NUDIX family)